jgi:4-amino-4-deoxy-L-arabinose transferase-like glycosyltransferase
VSVQSASARARAGAPALPAVLRSPLLLVGGVTLAAGFLRLHQIGATHTNPFYDAAVRSMGSSWHAFFFGAYEPAASLSIDKPPLDLWLQVASTKLFGWGPVALILPQALAATAAVPLLYDLVRRVFGRPAGIAAAAALAVLPVSVLTARSDTMDSLMMALSVLAAWLVVRAIERRQARWLYAAAVVAGLNFDVKLFEALAALPALVVLYALGASAPLRRRAAHIAVAGAAFVVAALWWPVAVSLAPSGSRPFPIGSTNGSVWNVMFVFNGIDRVHPPVGATQVRGVPAGPARLFDADPHHYGGFIGIELLAALLLGSIALFLLARRRSGVPLQRAFVVFLAAWLVPVFFLFSAVNQLHLRYLEALAPPVAATLGIGLAALAAAAGRRRAAAAGLLLGLAAVVAYALALGRRGAPEHLVSILAGGGVALVLAVAAGRGDRARPALAVAGALALACILAGPVARSAVVVDRGESDSGHPGDMAPAELRALAGYLGPRTRGDRYELASAYYARVGPLIARDGRSVIALTSVRRRPVVTTAFLEQAVRRGQVRYLLIGGSCGSRSPGAVARCPAAVRWARAHSVEVSRQAHLQRGLLFRFTRLL